MTVNINESNIVLWYNEILTEQEAQKYLDDNTFFIQGLVIPEGQKIKGKEAILCFSKEKKEFYYEYTDIPTKPLSDTEILMQSIADLELSNLEAAQERQLLAQQLTDLELAILERGM